jgi:hypothetical protein
VNADDAAGATSSSRSFEREQPLATQQIATISQRSTRLSAAPSLTAVDDQTVRQIVGRDCDSHAIAWQHADVMATHSPGELGAHDRATLVYPDVVLTAAEGILNDTLHFEKIALAHWLRFMKI